MAVKVFFYTILLICSVRSHAQETLFPFKELAQKPSVFNHVTERIYLPVELLHGLSVMNIGDSIDIPMGNLIVRFKAAVRVIDQNRATVNLSATNYHELLFTLTKHARRSNPEYTGRMISRNSGDALLIGFEKNRYFLSRIPINKLLAE